MEPLLNQNEQKTEETNTCATGLCCKSLKLLYKIVFFTLTLLLQFWFFFSFCYACARYQLENEINERWSVFLTKAIVASLQFMSVVSMFRALLANPGFVSDYFRSIELSVNEEGLPRYAIYKKEDFPENSANDIEDRL